MKVTHVPKSKFNPQKQIVQLIELTGRSSWDSLCVFLMSESNLLHDTYETKPNYFPYLRNDELTRSAAKHFGNQPNVQLIKKDNCANNYTYYILKVDGFVVRFIVNSENTRNSLSFAELAEHNRKIEQYSEQAKDLFGYTNSIEANYIETNELFVAVNIYIDYKVKKINVIFDFPSPNNPKNLGHSIAQFSLVQALAEHDNSTLGQRPKLKTPKARKPIVKRVLGE